MDDKSGRVPVIAFPCKSNLIKSVKTEKSNMVPESPRPNQAISVIFDNEESQVIPGAVQQFPANWFDNPLFEPATVS